MQSTQRVCRHPRHCPHCLHSNFTIIIFIFTFAYWLRAYTLGVYCVLSLTLSVCPSVCLSQTSNCFFFLVSRWNRAIFGRHFSMTPFTKRCSSIFDLGPLTPKIYSPKFAPLPKKFKLFLLFCFFMESSHFWPSVLHVALYKTLFFDFWFRPLTPKMYSPKCDKKSPISRFVWRVDRICLALPGGRPGGTTLVAMATTFAIGAESSRLPAC